MRIYRYILVLFAFMLVVTVGCRDRGLDQALESDANGFVCAGCKAKFYTDRDVFATRCPKCQKPKPEMVVGYVCATDNVASYGSRGQGAAVCDKCGKPTSTMNIPRESELKAWGAEKKTRAEVGG